MARMWCSVAPLLLLYFSLQLVNDQATTQKSVATTKPPQPATTEVTLKSATTVKSGKGIKTNPTVKATPSAKTTRSIKTTAKPSSTVKPTPTVKTSSTVKAATTIKRKTSVKTRPTVKTTTSLITTTETTVITTESTETTVVETTTSSEMVQKNDPVITTPTATLQTTTPTQTTTQPTPRNVNPYQLVENCRSVDPDFVLKLERGLPNDDRFKRFLRCIYVGKNAMTDSGEINNQVIMNFLLRRLRSMTLAQSVFQRCVKKADSPENTAYLITTCLRDNGVNVFVRGRRRD